MRPKCCSFFNQLKHLSICALFLQFELSSLMHWIFLPAAACKIQFWNRPKIRFLKLEIFQTGELQKSRADRGTKDFLSSYLLNGFLTWTFLYSTRQCLRIKYWGWSKPNTNFTYCISDNVVRCLMVSTNQADPVCFYFRNRNFSSIFSRASEASNIDSFNSS